MIYRELMCQIKIINLNASPDINILLLLVYDLVCVRTNFSTAGNVMWFLV